MGHALRTRWLWQQYAGQQGFSGLLPCSADSTTMSFFRASTRPLLGDGSTFMFWSSPWLQGQSIEEIAPELFAAVARRARKNRTVAATLNNNAWRNDITGALTILVLVQFLQLHQRLEGVALQPGTPDKLLWKWTASGSYPTESAFKAMFIGQASIPGVRELWKSKAPGKCHFFVWLLLLGRCWTSQRL
jgi:hypothetical protein